MKTTFLFIPFIFLFAKVCIAQDAEFRVCNEKNLYAVDFVVLKDYLDKKMKEPDTPPVYSEGLKKLRLYFNEHPLDNPDNKNLTFRLYIAFLVNCEGRAGDFRIISDHDTEEATQAHQAIEIVKNMPQLWKPAEYKGAKADCYQVLSITIMNNRFATVFYNEPE